MHVGFDSAVFLIYLAVGLSDLLIIPFALQLQPSKLHQAILAALNGAKCVEISRGVYQNVYTLGETDLAIASFEAFKTTFVDFKSFALALLAIDRFVALRNSGRYREKRGTRCFWYARVLAPALVLIALTSFCSYLYAAHAAIADPTQQATGKIFTAFEAFRFFYLSVILVIVVLFFIILIWKVVVQRNDQNDLSFRRSAILALLCILINLPTAGYLMAFCAVQIGISVGLFLQTAFGLKTPWAAHFWVINDQLVIWQSVAYFKIVNLTILAYLCCSRAYRKALLRLFSSSISVTPERTKYESEAEQVVTA